MARIVTRSFSFKRGGTFRAAFTMFHEDKITPKNLEGYVFQSALESEARGEIRLPFNEDESDLAHGRFVFLVDDTEDWQLGSYEWDFVITDPNGFVDPFPRDQNWFVKVIEGPTLT